MEALIDYYELDVAEGNTPDARIPLEIKKTLDWLAANAYVAATHTLVYNFYDLPRDPTLVGGADFSGTELNDLVAPAYAWYWSLTGDAASLANGDDLFNHAFDSASFYNPSGYLGNGWTWSAKEFNQIYKWSFDFVRWRTLPNAVSTVMPASNPCENSSTPCVAPWPDLAPPIQFTWAATAQSGWFPTVSASVSPSPTVTSTTATFQFNSYEPATAIVYYQKAAPNRLHDAALSELRAGGMPGERLQQEVGARRRRLQHQHDEPVRLNWLSEYLQLHRHHHQPTTQHEVPLAAVVNRQCRQYRGVLRSDVYDHALIAGQKRAAARSRPALADTNRTKGCSGEFPERPFVSADLDLYAAYQYGSDSSTPVRHSR